jgi:hypothetical protein
MTYSPPTAGVSPYTARPVDDRKADQKWKRFLATQKRKAEAMFAKSREYSETQKKTWRKINAEIKAGKRAPVNQHRTPPGPMKHRIKTNKQAAK